MSAGSMTLRELLGDSGAPDIRVSGLSEDSRTIEPGYAFVAVRGEAADGHGFTAQAAGRGAVCVLAERHPADSGIPVVVVDRLRERRGALAARFHGDPSRKLRCIGVTGTNGKTSIAHYLAELAGRLGQRAGYLGTLGWGEVGRLQPAALTTADAIATQRRLACLRRNGGVWACMEASSHALAQGRVDHVRFEGAVFSNLSREHLDYHADFAAYGAAKRRLFEFPSVRFAVVNVDDAFGRALAANLRGPEVLSVGRNGAELSWGRVRFHESGASGRLASPWGTEEFDVPVFGEFSLANVAAAIGTLAAGGLSFRKLVDGAGRLGGVPGRMEFFRKPGLPTVVVDYAHTPDALANALAALAGHCRGRLLCVVGCGGNRDRGKRPLMARAAVAAADAVWLTSDNPRWEEPAAIVAEMRAGLEPHAAVYEELDRAAAIAGALAAAGPRDLVVVAGKGHETFQEIRGCRRPFSDRETVRRALAGTG